MIPRRSHWLRRPLHALTILAWTLVTCLARGAMGGATGPPRPQIAQIRIGESASGGPVELVPSGTSYLGRFDVSNVGSEALEITRISVRTTAADPRVPVGLEASFDNGALAATLPPHTSRTIAVRWSGATEGKMRELYGHVIVESSTSDHLPRAVGIHADVPRESPLLSRHILSLLTFLPLGGFALISIVGALGLRDPRRLRWITLVVMGLNLILASWLYLHFDRTVAKVDGNDGYQFIEHASWIPALGAEYFLGVDGISITMVWLTAFLCFLGVLPSFSIERKLPGYFAMYCLLATGMMGVFLALDLLLFYVFWELMLLPMYFLIGIWGGPRREYAAIKFFLYTLAGSVFMLLGFLALYDNSDPSYLVDGSRALHTFNMSELARVDFAGKGLTIFNASFVKVCFWALFAGFAIKIPIVPFHTWLPDAHVEAPTAVSVILAGVLLKMGTYGILRVNFGILPDASVWAAPAIAAFGAINIVYGALCAMAQRDLKRLIAYSSVSHMGYCLLAMASLTPIGITACIVQMFNHGTISAMLFMLVGVIYDRAHTRDIDAFGGLAQKMPLYTAFTGFAFMASLGIPGLSGFIGEVLTLVGAFPVYHALTVIAATAVVLTAAYHLWAFQRMFLGKYRDAWEKSPLLERYGGQFPDINAREVISLAPLVILVALFGLWPKPLLSVVESSVLDLFHTVSGPGANSSATNHTSTVRATASR